MDPAAAAAAAAKNAKLAADDTPPSQRMLAAYHAYLALAQQLGREPTAEEAFPLVKHLSRHLRGRTAVGSHRQAGKRGSTIVARRDVDQFVRRVAARCGAYYGGAERVAGIKSQLADLALRTARDVLTNGGPYDANAQLCNAKGKFVIDLLRVSGLSDEVRPGGPEAPSGVLGRTLSPAEEALLDAAKRAEYERQMAPRMGAGAAAAVNRIPADSRN